MNARKLARLGGATPWIALSAAAAAAVGFGALAVADAGRGGALVVESEPAGASVFVDGVFHGVTPLGLRRLVSGAHTVRLEKAGYRTAFASADPSGGRGVDRVELEPEPTGGLDVGSTPAGAEVYLDGEFRGVTPLSLEGLRPGPRSVRVEKTNCRPATATVVIRPGGRAAREFELADRVLEFLTRAVEAEPDRLAANMELGHYLVTKNEVEQGIEYYRRGLIAGGDMIVRACGSGRLGTDVIWAQRKRIESQIQKDCRLPAPMGPKVRVLAEAARREVEKTYPRNLLLALTYARQREATGSNAAVAGAMEKLARGAPHNPLPWSCLAVLRMRSGDREAAIDALREGFGALGGDVEAGTRLVEECLAEPVLSEGEEAAEQVLDLCARELARLRGAAAGKNALAAARLEIKILRKARRGEEALARVDETLPLEVDPLARGLLELEKGRILASMGRGEDAVRLLKKIAKSAPSADVREEARRELGALEKH